MKRRFLSPFAPVESQVDARALQDGSVAGFALWGLAFLAQGGAVMAGLGTEDAASRGASAGFAVALAVLAAAVALVQARKPNRILPVFGIAWALYDLSSILVGAMVGAPMAMGGLPLWIGLVVAVVAGVCAALHIGALRGTGWLARQGH